ncbi:sphingomyelin synthase-related protein 1 [Aplysia californica]|uniref:Sphingomyelin synthase-related protein 1 n=1 Tax=Aplysia californica TaxID=6500 RepID=A0ABM0JRZ5_APLCA|nr:sphingomyelin synthase-related protein 1 [Aplysia californica]XP_012938950.1 sphingomyelin synthase-related protein 1 [Aplysia californica]XP_035826105.1 sphingomyelin synthase-related protein 1 [Aplysia californica]
MEDKLENVDTWTCEDVEKWLKANGFIEYATKFSQGHRIDGQGLLSLTEKDLKDPPMSIPYLGDIKRLSFKIHALQAQNIKPSKLIAREAVHLLHESSCRERTQPVNPGYDRQGTPSRQDSTESEGFDNSLFQGTSVRSRHTFRNSTCSPSQDIPMELWKTVLSFLYIFVVFLITAFIMVVVHDRVPEMDRYPPLPDLFLDNMPYVPWAFEACEMVGLVLAIMWFALLFFHKHRFILMRRLFSLMGTIFLLRCVTMLITSLSVPGKHLQCSGRRYGDFYSRLERAIEIWQGFGMSLQGVRTCGDYMFSGHTSIITLLNFFITEYTPRKYYFVHIISWCLNFFGIFFLLAAHEHYSIDVFMAFYLSSRLFMYYHTLANNRALMQPDARRTRIWFPLFAFFESKCQGRVPNQFEWPLVYFAPCMKQIGFWIKCMFSKVGRKPEEKEAVKTE